MALYDLLVRGFSDFTRLANVLDQQTISRDPLSGVLDETSLVFHTNYFPILTSGSLGVYVNGALVSGTADYNTGEITLTSPPDSQPVANYIYTPYTARQISQFTIQGFNELEGQWSRGWQLLDGSGNWADEDSTNIYVTDGQGNDPQCGSVKFSQSRVQVSLFILCCEYRFAKTQFRQSALNDYMWRESVRGMTVDKSKRPDSINNMIDDLKEELDRTLEQAQAQSYPGGENYGAFYANPVTLEYVANFEWQTSAKQNDYRSLEGFNVAYRPLTYFP